MKKLLIYFLLIVCGSIVSSAQEVKKELKTEKDGYKWYKTSQNNFYGAESLDGKTIIPLSKKYISIIYESPYLCGSYRPDKPGSIFKNEYYTKEGKEIIDNSKYDTTYLLGGKNDEPFWFRTKKDGKQGACDINGNEIIPPIFEVIIYSSSDGEFTIKDGKSSHKWSEYKSQTNNSSASSNTPSKASTIEELFNLAYKTPDAEAQTKFNRYVEVIEADPYNTYGYKALAYNNIGALYEKLGDLKNARKCYEYALQADPNFTKAKENLSDVKAQRRNQRLSNLSNTLSALGQTLSTMSNNQNQAGGTYNASQGGGTYDGSSGSSSSGSSKSTVCKRCQGSGKCSSSSPSANKYYCHGSKKCGYCNGGTAHGYGKSFVCTACEGSGRCKYCNGTGRCSDCGGNGTS